MNILVIGNGFDLAHGLPTKYTDFLEFCRMVRCIYDEEKLDESMDECWDRLNIKVSYYKDELKYIFMEAWNKREINLSKYEFEGQYFQGIITNTYLDKVDEYIGVHFNDNLWIRYFLNYSNYSKGNWIDFESEISKVIQQLNNDMFYGEAQKYQLTDEVVKLSNDFLNQTYSGYTFIMQSIGDFLEGESKAITFKEIRDRLHSDLNKLIRALELYLTEFVGNMEIMKMSPDIRNIRVDRLLSFNYTETYSTNYGSVELENIDYIHGEADANNTIESNNMVLGIDEYLSDEQKNKDIDFIAFKKFYQRIYKQTGCKYREWVDVIKESAKPIVSKLRTIYPTQIPFVKFPDKHNLYIFGHSLDVTDKDILRDLILNDNVYTTIYYFSKDDLGTKIANLVKVIGQDELIKRTGGITKTIEFKLQQNMVERK